MPQPASQSVPTPLDGGGAPLAPGMRSELVRQLFEQHNRALVGFLVARLDSEAEAHEVAQEAYVRLLQLEQPSAVSFLRAHLFSIASNLAVDRLRHRQVRDRNASTEFFENLLTRPGPERAVLAQQELGIIRAALRELPEKCRRVFVMHMFGGQSVQEIAASMQLTDRMIRHYIARALATCRQRMDESARS